MPRQSTRVRYKSRRERKKNEFRIIRLILLFAIPILLIVLSRHWSDWVIWFKSLIN